MASYRYRAEIPARGLGASVNDPTADVLVYAKPSPEELGEMCLAQELGKTVVVDFCDDHFSRLPHYREVALTADAVTCPTRVMAGIVLEATGRMAEVIPDPYEFEEEAPHCSGDKALWFGHAVNKQSLLSVLPKIDSPLTVVSNIPGAIPWSIETMYREFKKADVVIIPKTATYKSPNRAIESIRQGCFVVAEQHPSIENIPGIWIGDIKEGIEWASRNQQEANKRTKLAQDYIRELYAPRTVSNAWKSLLERVRLRSTLGQVPATGTDG